MSKNRAVVVSFVNVLILLAVFAAVISTGRAADRSSREYVVSVDAQKSDTVRMIEAYERLSSQYLTLVQQNLNQMAASDRDILTKLSAIEKKLDDLAARLDKLQKAETTAKTPD